MITEVNDHAANNPLPRYKGIASTVKLIYRTEGVKGFFRGIGVYFVGSNLANVFFFYM